MAWQVDDACPPLLSSSSLDALNIAFGDKKLCSGTLPVTPEQLYLFYGDTDYFRSVFFAIRAFDTFLTKALIQADEHCSCHSHRA